MYMKTSETFPLAGEGAYARIDIPANTMFAVYGGHVMSKKEIDELSLRQNEEFDARGLPKDSMERYDAWKYRY